MAVGGPVSGALAQRAEPRGLCTRPITGRRRTGWLDGGAVTRAWIALAIAAGASAAQPNDDVAARLRRLDSLVVIRLAELRADDRAEIEARRLRPVIVDGLRLLVDSSFIETGSTGFRLGVQDVRARGDEWATRTLADLEIRVVRENDAFSGGRGLSIVASNRENPALSARTPVFGLDATAVRHATAALFDRLLRNSLDFQMTLWLDPELRGGDVRVVDVSQASADNSLFGPVDASGPAWYATRLHALRTPAASTRNCLSGSPHACALSLGLGTESPAPVTTWYAPSDFKWVAHQVSRDADSTRRRDLQGCDRGEHDACDRFVASAPPGQAQAPLAMAQPRQALVMLALDAGGTGAVDRLLNSRGNIDERLERTAGVPLDSLLTIFGHRVGAAHTSHPRVQPVALLMAALVAASLLVSPGRRA